jgi:nucleoside-diphosphate-sugar epimerase
VEHAIIRCTHIYGRGSRWLEAMRAAARRPIATVVGPGTQRLAPTYVGDVAAVLAAADDRATGVGGTFGLEGPDEITADSLIDLLAGHRKRKLHLSPRAAHLGARAVGEQLSAALAEVLSSDSLADAPSAADEFGVKRTPILEGLEASR